MVFQAEIVGALLLLQADLCGGHFLGKLDCSFPRSRPGVAAKFLTALQPRHGDGALYVGGPNKAQLSAQLS